MRKNVLGDDLIACCYEPVTGFYRDGFCRTDDLDGGKHVVCAVMTDDFLKFSLQMGNDLSTPRPQNDFPGLKAGDKWCLCAFRWKEAYENNCAPNVYLAATAQEALEYVGLDELIGYSI